MRKTLFMIILAALSVSLQAKETWLFVRPLNYYYDQSKLFVISDLLKQELQVQGGMTVKMVERPENGPDLESDAKGRKEALQLTQTDLGFSGKVSQIENTVFMYVYKWNSSGDMVYQERISVPLGEDPEALVKRLAKCLITHEKFTGTATSTTVTVKETQRPRRKEGSLSIVGRTGILYPWNTSFRVKKASYNYNYNGTGTYDTSYIDGNTFSMELGLAYDVNFMILEGTAGFDGTRDVTFTIAGDYLFGQGDFCPYVGGEVGVALVNKASFGYDMSETEAEKNSDGFYGGLRVGILLFRNNSVKFMPEIRGINVFNKDWDKGIRATIGMMVTF